MKSTDLQLILRGLYETSHGIFNHEAAQEDHFSLVRFNWAEDPISSSRLRERMEAYLNARVGNNFHLSFTEFLEQPSYVCDLMLEVLEKKAPEQEAELQTVLSEFRGTTLKGK